ncbi:hypothetical protein LG943_13240 [Streptomonospora sp. S1-112]|uniref:Uncharacterized protein n=1 Tax=Streptomonospora mangrovi TaxID=2883123 RepID=A0A9X3SNP2_9ACTN|nr:hypothetical protein [Streptomonospora mangrovi]MDA0565271.1 hypothetical protein [Streptomonospora mangrovi]
MANPVSPATQTGRSTKTPRRTRASVLRRRSGEARTATTAMPQPRVAAEAVASDRPLLTWELVTDETGRTRPQARWI